MFDKHIFFILILNFIVYIFSYKLNIERSIFNLDYFVFSIIFICLYNYYNNRFKAIPSVLLFFIISIDILNLLVQVFPFIYIEDFFYLLFFFISGPDKYQAWSLIIVALVTTIVLIFHNIEYKQTDKKRLTLLLILFLFIGQSQSLIFINDQYSKYKEIESNHKLKSNMKYEYISKDIMEDMSSNSKKILLVVNESWGSTKDKNIQQSILNPIYKNRDSYEYISDGSYNFEGSTISGELRELCQKYANVMNITKVKNEEFINCLPSKFKQNGYDTYAIHGTNGELYDRQRWYRLVGFDNILFNDSFENARDCKLFSGKCDYDLLEPISDIFANNEKVFLYWLTLNTHSPYNDKLFIKGFNCEKYKIRPDSEACLSLKQQYQFFYRLSEYVQDDRMRGVEVYVVGDHAPPIISLKDNSNPFKNSKIGWLKFKVKDE